MSYQLPTDEQQLAVESFRQFLEAEILPIVSEYRDCFIPREKMLEIARAIAEFGLPSGSVPEEYGGMGLSWTTQAMLFEELARVSCDLAIVVLINIVGAHLLMTGERHLVERYLPELLSGNSFVCLGVSESDVGSNVAELKTRARRDGNVFIVNGEKTWITNGMYSDFMICTARTGEKVLSQLLIDRREHGYEPRNIDKMGLVSQSTAQIVINDARVPVTNVIGVEGDGLRKTMVLFERARAHVGMLSVGLMRAALEKSIAYAKERTQFGRPIAAHQLIAAKIADMATLTDASRLMCFRVFALIDAGVRCDVEASMAKWFATEMAIKVCRDAVQLHGANGISKEFNVERLLRDAIIIPIPDGTTEIQKLIISRALTGVSAIS